MITDIVVHYTKIRRHVAIHPQEIQETFSSIDSTYRNRLSLDVVHLLIFTSQHGI